VTGDSEVPDLAAAASLVERLVSLDLTGRERAILMRLSFAAADAVQNHGQRDEAELLDEAERALLRELSEEFGVH
jgi:hypothetical protein